MDGKTPQDAQERVRQIIANSFMVQSGWDTNPHIIKTWD